VIFVACGQKQKVHLGDTTVAIDSWIYMIN